MIGIDTFNKTLLLIIGLSNSDSWIVIAHRPGLVFRFAGRIGGMIAAVRIFDVVIAPAASAVVVVITTVIVSTGIVWRTIIPLAIVIPVAVAGIVGVNRDSIGCAAGRIVVTVIAVVAVVVIVAVARAAGITPVIIVITVVGKTGSRVVPIVAG